MGTHLPDIVPCWPINKITLQNTKSLNMKRRENYTFCRNHTYHLISLKDVEMILPENHLKRFSPQSVEMKHSTLYFLSLVWTAPITSHNQTPACTCRDWRGIWGWNGQKHRQESQANASLLPSFEHIRLVARFHPQAHASWTSQESQMAWTHQNHHKYITIIYNIDNGRTEQYWWNTKKHSHRRISYKIASRFRSNLLWFISMASNTLAVSGPAVPPATSDATGALGVHSYQAFFIT